MIAEAAASIPILLYEGDSEIETHPLLDLMRRPNGDHSGTDFLEAWYGYLLVSGNAYVEAVAVDGEIRELHNLRPDRMKVIPGADGWPEGYEYTVSGRSVRFIDNVTEGVRPILHTRLFHPANDHYGMSPIEAAAVAIDIHNTASGWNKALLDNSARPSGALVYAATNGQMTEEQFARLKCELEANYQGAAHAGRPPLLEGGLDWKPLRCLPDRFGIARTDNCQVECGHVSVRRGARRAGGRCEEHIAFRQGHVFRRLVGIFRVSTPGWFGGRLFSPRSAVVVGFDRCDRSVYQVSAVAGRGAGRAAVV
jgi:HK97 family phage portal protein